MCKVYEFPTKAQLTQEIAERLQKLAKDYVNGMCDLLDSVEERCSSEEEYNELATLAFNMYMTELFKAIDTME